MALKMRPVLDHRMPTLAGKMAFLKPVSRLSGANIYRKKSAIQQLEDSPAKSLKEVRKLLLSEIKSVLRRINRMERSYYGEQMSIHHEAESFTYPIRSVMKSVLIFECNSVAAVDEVLKKTTAANYNGSLENIQKLKDMYAKVKSYFPEKVNGVSIMCHSVFDMLNKYCRSFYSKDEGYLETADNYEEQIESWRLNIETSLNNSRDVFRRFRGRGLNISHLTPPVQNFVSKYNLPNILIVVMFADACTNLRNALSLMSAWIRTDEMYSSFVKSDVLDLDSLKEERVTALREAKNAYHSMMFRKTQMEVEHSKLMGKTDSLKLRREQLRKEEAGVLEKLQEKELEIEFKEYRRDGLKRKSNRARDEQEKEENDDVPLEITLELYEKVVEEILTSKEQLPWIQKQLSIVRHKLGWVEMKYEEMERTADEIQSMAGELEHACADKQRKEEEYLTVGRNLKQARKIFLCKTSNDAIEKIFYSIPVHAKNAKTSDSASKTKGPLDKACKVIIRNIEKDWSHLYRNLPFFPNRGSENIERDISELSTTGARANLVVLTRLALNRWRRHHTRAMVSDLQTALKKIKRLDVAKAIEDELKPPITIDEEGDPDDKIPPVPPELLEFYELGEKFDRLRALNKLP